jgi:hypothetical protein
VSKGQNNNNPNTKTAMSNTKQHKQPVGFKPYAIPKNGLFAIHTGTWLPSNAWETINETHLIIGEDSDTFVCKVIPYEVGMWVGDKVIKEHQVLAIGIHKTRLLRWLPTQTQLNL